MIINMETPTLCPSSNEAGDEIHGNLHGWYQLLVCLRFKRNTRFVRIIEEFICEVD